MYPIFFSSIIAIILTSCVAIIAVLTCCKITSADNRKENLGKLFVLSGRAKMMNDLFPQFVLTTAQTFGSNLKPAELLELFRDRVDFVGVPRIVDRFFLFLFGKSRFSCLSGWRREQSKPSLLNSDFPNRSGMNGDKIKYVLMVRLQCVKCFFPKGGVDSR